jgi:hypothetical protein
VGDLTVGGHTVGGLTDYRLESLPTEVSSTEVLQYRRKIATAEPTTLIGTHLVVAARPTNLLGTHLGQDLELGVNHLKIFVQYSRCMARLLVQSYVF